MFQNDSETQKKNTSCYENERQSHISAFSVKPLNETKTSGKFTEDQLKSLLYQKEYQNGALLVEKERLEKVISQLEKDKEFFKMELRNIQLQKEKNLYFFEKEREIIREFSQKSLRKLSEAKDFSLIKLDEIYQKQLQRSQNLCYDLNQITKQKIRIETEQKFLEKKLKRATCVYPSIIAILAVLFMGSCLLCTSLLMPNVCQDLQMRQREMQQNLNGRYYDGILNEVNKLKSLQNESKNQCPIM